MEHEWEGLEIHGRMVSTTSGRLIVDGFVGFPTCSCLFCLWKQDMACDRIHVGNAFHPKHPKQNARKTNEVFIVFVNNLFYDGLLDLWTSSLYFSLSNP